MRYVKLIFLIFVILILSKYSYSQLTRADLISAYLYNFMKNTEWPDEKNINEYNVTILCADKEIIQGLDKMANSQKIRGKPISLTVLNVLNSEFIESQVIFVGEDKHQFYSEVFDEVINKPILLVGENVENKRVVLINLFDTNDGKVGFEYNKSNIDKQGLVINDEILLTGGSEIDVVELYLESKQNLLQLEKKLSEYNAELKKLNEMIAESEEKVVEKQEQLILQEERIKAEKIKYNQLQKEIHSFESQMSTQKSLLAEERAKLSKMSDKLLKNKRLLDTLNSDILTGESILKEQKEKINEQKNELASMEEVVGEQDKTINRQKQVMYLFILIILLIFILTINIFRNYKKKKQVNEQLNLQKRAIENTNKELKYLNEELNEKNIELQASLEKIQSIQQQLIQSEKMASIGVLSAGIAHEINNPINFVYAGINSLKKDFNDLLPILREIQDFKKNDEDFKEKVENIIRLKNEIYYADIFESLPQTISDIQLGAVRTAEIVKGLRNFSRMDKEDQQIVDIHQELDSTLILLKNRYKNKVEVDKAYTKQIIRIKGYPGKLNQAFLNIISNSIDAITENGKIQISTQLMENYVEIKIADSGVGMCESTKSKMFDPFYTTKDVGQGTGLGLSITYGIIKEHNGEIQVESKENIGTIFTIKLPVK